MAASIFLDRIFAAAPNTTRGQPTQLSADTKGERLAYASGKAIFIRSIDRPTECSQYDGHTVAATVARFSPSSFKVASGDVSGVVRVWEPASIDTTRGEFGVFNGRVTDLAWDGDSQRIMAVGDGKERFGKAITADTGNSVGEVNGHSKVINSVALRQQRPFRAATVSDDGSMCFLHGVPFVFKSKESATHAGFVLGTAFSPDGSTLVTVGADKAIWLYDGKDGKPKGQIGAAAPHTSSILAVAWAPDGRGIVTASADQTVRLWDVEAGKESRRWRFGGDGISVPHQQVGVVYPHGRSDGTIISLGLNGDLNFLRESDPGLGRAVRGHNKAITALGPGSDGSGRSGRSTLLTGSFDGRVCSWDAATGVGTVIAGQTHTNQVVQFAAERPGRIVSAGWDDTLRAIDEDAGTFLGEARSLPAQPRGVAAAGDSGIVYVATASGLVVLAADKQVAEHALPFVPTCVAVHGKLVAVGGDGNRIRVYRDASRDASAPAATLSEIAAPESPMGPASALAFSPDGKHLAAGNAVGKIYVYDCAGWAIVVDRWSAHTARVTCLAWDESGQHAVSGGIDASVFVWCLDKAYHGKRIKAANAHKGGVSGVCWVGASKGSARTVASVGADAAVKLWRVENLP